MKTAFLAASAMVAATFAMPAMAGIVITLEAPGVNNTTQSLQEFGVETFDSYSAGVHSIINSNFGGTSSYSGTYTNAQIMSNDSWGGAEASQYAVALGQGASYTLDLNKSADYFGFYLTALSSGNVMQFFDGGNKLLELNYTDLLGYITDAGPGYMGSPVPGQTSSEYFAFFNFNFTDGDSYNRIVFSNTGTDGFESDNHTVGMAAVPEPATWALLIAGFGLVGVAARRRRISSALS